MIEAPNNCKSPYKCQENLKESSYPKATLDQKEPKLLNNFAPNTNEAPNNCKSPYKCQENLKESSHPKATLDLKAPKFLNNFAPNTNELESLLKNKFTLLSGKENQKT